MNIQLWLRLVTSRFSSIRCRSISHKSKRLISLSASRCWSPLCMSSVWFGPIQDTTVTRRNWRCYLSKFAICLSIKYNRRRRQDRNSVDIFNLAIEFNYTCLQAKRYLDPSSIFHTDIDEAMQRITLSVQTLKQFRSEFDYYKENLVPFFKEENYPPILWTFHPNAVFDRFNAFLERLNTIQWFVYTLDISSRMQCCVSFDLMIWFRMLRHLILN